MEKFYEGSCYSVAVCIFSDLHFRSRCRSVIATTNVTVQSGVTTYMVARMHDCPNDSRHPEVRTKT